MGVSCPIWNACVVCDEVGQGSLGFSPQSLWVIWNFQFSPRRGENWTGRISDRVKRNMAYTKPTQPGNQPSLLSEAQDNKL